VNPAALDRLVMALPKPSRSLIREGEDGGGLPRRVEPTFTDSGSLRGQDCSFRSLEQRQIACRAPGRRQSHVLAVPLRQNAAFCLRRAHLTHGSVAASDLSAAHAGAGGARSRAISDRMSANICRDTATSASWKVT
jgi:hypothetical protein